METRSVIDLTSDVLFTLAISLDLPDLLKFCASSKKINDNVCKKDNIWYYRLNKDFPDWREGINSQEQGIIKNPKTLQPITETKTPKDIYILLYWHNIFKTLKEKLKIRQDINEIYSLKELSVNNNEIKEIPKEIGNLSNLQVLSLGYNEIKEIPPAIGKLSNLEYLYLSNNAITVIPPEIGKLSNLEYLYLSNNAITEIPPEIEQLSKLRVLYLYNNNITEIPPELGSLSNLQTLYLSGNKIKDIETVKKMLKEKLPQLIIYI